MHAVALLTLVVGATTTAPPPPSPPSLWAPPWCTFPNATVPRHATLGLGYADVMTKVFPTANPTAEPCPSSEVVLRASGSERQAFQIVLTPGERLAASVTVTLDPSKGNVSVFKLGYTHVSGVADPVANNRTGPYPDALLPGTHSDMLPLATGEAQPYWVQLSDLRPDPTDRGEIYASLSIATITAQGAQLPITLTIKVIMWDFAVPAPANASQALGAKFNEELPIFLGPNQHVDNQQFDQLAFENWAEHRVNKYVWMPVGGVAMNISADLSTVSLDTTEFDSRVTWLLQHGVTDIRFPVPSTNSEWMFSTIDGDWTQCHSATLNASWTFGPVLGTTPRSSGAPLTVPVFAGADIAHAHVNPLFAKLFALVNGALIAHIDSNGWIPHIVAEFVDEPHFLADVGELDRTLLKNFTATQLNNFTRFAVVSVAKMWKALHPQLRLQQTADDPSTLGDPSMRQLVDTWIINNRAYKAPGVAASMAQLRRERPAVVTSFYHNAIPVVDLPAIRVRSFPWQIWRTNYAYNETRHYGLQGSLSWYTNTRWKMDGGINLYVCANAGPVYGCVTPGDPCVDNAAGLANLLYPPLDGDSMKPVSSVRWELLAIGLQDVEAFVSRTMDQSQ
jgi:hypothetical protein